MVYEIYFGNKLMPVTPSSVHMTVRNKNKTLVQINDGEINLLKRPGLTDIQLTLLLPNVQYPFAKYPNGFERAEHYLAYLKELKESGKPFKWILVRSIGQSGQIKLFDTNLSVSLEEYRIVEDAKNGFDVEVEVRLKQYRDFATKMITVTSPLPTAPMAVQEIRPYPPRPVRTNQAEQRIATGGASGAAGGAGGGGSRLNVITPAKRAEMAAKKANKTKETAKREPSTGAKNVINKAKINVMTKKAMKKR